MPGTVVTIGNFDGVHRGHATLIARARDLAGPAGRVVVLSFDPHPSAVLRPGTEPDRLTTFAHRAELLRGAGADEVRRLEPDRALLSMTPDEFLGHVCRAFQPTALVEGADFHFGRGRTGNVRSLADIGARLGFAVEVVPPVRVALLDHAEVIASSSILRWLLRHGRVADAAIVLGRPYALTGPIVAGDRRGREIGFPTANLAPPEQTPPGPGVYACTAELPGSRELPAAVHVGDRPTVGDADYRIEAHILGLPTAANAPGRRNGEWSPIEGLSETGWRCTLRFHSRLRDPIRFASVEALKAQVARDCRRTLELAESPARHEEIHA